MTIEILHIAGMRGERDRQTVLAAVTAVPGVRRAVANLADRTVRLERDDDASLAAILTAVQTAGYGVSVAV